MSNRTLIVLARSNSWYAPLITAITDTWFNHTFILFEDMKFGGWMALDILADGPVILPLSRAMKRYKRIECYEYNDTLWRGIKQSKDDIGGGYDWLGLFSSILKLALFKIFRIKRLKPVHWASKYMCFEWVLTIMKRNGVEGGENLDPILVPPAEFSHFLDKHERFSYVDTPNEVVRALNPAG